MSGIIFLAARGPRTDMCNRGDSVNRDLNELHKQLGLGRAYQDFQSDCVAAFELANTLRQALKDCLASSSLHDKISGHVS